MSLAILLLDIFVCSFRLKHFAVKKMSLKLFCSSLIPKFQALHLKNVVQPAVNMHTTAIASGKINRMKDRTSMLRTVVKKGDGTTGEKSVDLDNLIQRFVSHTLNGHHSPDGLISFNC